MKNYTYNFEIKDLLTQFAAAFDDVIIKRYNKDRVAEQTINVRYVLAPKQRVMYDIVNKAQNLTVPVIAFDVKSISRDQNRVFNKLDKLYNYVDERTSNNIGMPVPVNIEVTVSILARYMQDMDQILSNFIPYSNPYVVITYKEPQGDTEEEIEIRTEVNWSGNIAFNNPTDTTFSDKFRIVADTNFTIKGWLFKNQNTTTPPVISIKVNTINVNNGFFIDNLDDTDDYTTTVKKLSADTSVSVIDGRPSLSDMFLFTGSDYIRMFPLFTFSRNISSRGDTYGLEGTYGPGSPYGIEYGANRRYYDAEDYAEVLFYNNAQTMYDFSAFNFNKRGGYSSGSVNLEGGGNYLIVGNNLSQIEYALLSSNNFTEFYNILSSYRLPQTILNTYNINYIQTNLINFNITDLRNKLETFKLQNILNFLLSSGVPYNMLSSFDFNNTQNILATYFTWYNRLSDVSLPTLFSLLTSFDQRLKQTSPLISSLTCIENSCGFVINPNRYTSLNSNVVTINLPYIPGTGNFDIVLRTKLGSTTVQSITSTSTCCGC